jgi:hypothetical protein
VGATGAHQLEPTVKIHVTRGFARDVAALQDHLGGKAELVLDILAESFEKLKGYKWDDSLPIKPYGIYGDSFSFDFTEDYSFTFKNITDSDERGLLVIVEHYILKNLLRRR